MPAVTHTSHHHRRSSPVEGSRNDSFFAAFPAFERILSLRSASTAGSIITINIPAISPSRNTPPRVPDESHAASFAAGEIVLTAARPMVPTATKAQAHDAATIFW